MRRFVVAAAVAVLAVMAASPSRAQAPAAGAAAGEAGVRTVVTGFGKRLRDVSLTAPKAAAAKAMDGAYAPYLAPKLLAAWKRNPQKAAGKQTSSPYPARIEIATIKPEEGKKGRDAFVVTGKVILLTAKEERDGGAFASNPVTMTIEKQQGRWLITAYEEKEGD